MNNSIANSVALLGFLWRREYLALGDQEFTRLADFLRCFLAGYLVLLLITLAIFVTTIQLDREHGATSSSRGPGC